MLQTCQLCKRNLKRISKAAPIFTPLSNSSTTQLNGNKRKRLVVLGTGWAGYSLLRSINKKLFDVIVVSPRNHFLFTPLLASTTVGTLEFRSIIEPVRNLGFRDDTHFHHSQSLGVDINSRSVLCESVLNKDLSYKIEFDYLVIGVGAVSNTFGIPGVKENAFFLKEVTDAMKIRDQLLSNFELSCEPSVSELERDRLLHTVIVGGGPTGVEFGAELYDFIEQEIGRLYRSNASKVKVTLIEAHGILSSFDETLRKSAEKKIIERKRFKLLQGIVKGVNKSSVDVQIDQKIISIDCGLLVWSTGLAPRDFTASLEVPKNKQGQIVTDGFLRVKSTPPNTIFAIGDCADIEASPLPCTAQVAERQGRYLASYLAHVVKCKDLSTKPDNSFSPFKFTSFGMLAYIGKHEGLSDLPSIKLKGFISWLLWRSAYLTRIGSWRSRLQVAVDWSKTILFGRDTSQFR